MKIYAFFIVCSLFLLTLSCQNMGTKSSNGDYYAGVSAGEEIAKQDVLDIQGNISKSSNVFIIKKNTNKHLKQMESSLSNAYIHGFKWGYKRAFANYNDVYNGGG